jgi:hypothetical protein
MIPPRAPLPRFGGGSMFRDPEPQNPPEYSEREKSIDISDDFPDGDEVDTDQLAQSNPDQFNPNNLPVPIGIEGSPHEWDGLEEEGVKRLSSGEDTLFDASVTRGPGFEQEAYKILHETARDESLPETVFFILNSHLSKRAKLRKIAGAAAFLSKNPVYSYLTNPLDFMQAQDDYWMFHLVHRIGLTSFDRNVDFMTADAIIEGNFNLRLRRSRDALNLKSLTTSTTRAENVDMSPRQQEERTLRSKIPLIGSLLGG